jgi:argininosuccinate synthase
MVDIANEVGADAVSHGCTGKGNDQACIIIIIISLSHQFIYPCVFFEHVLLICVQVRFELSFFALNPKLNVVAPWREWDITGREDAIEYAKKHNVPVPVTKKSIYSRDRNLWHITHEVSFQVIIIVALNLVQDNRYNSL